MHPILFSVGPFRLPTYGLLLATALIAAVYTAGRLGKREGLDSARLFDFNVWLIVVALLGAKVLMILTDWDYYRGKPGQIFSRATLEAGGVFYGGFIAAALFALWYVRIHALPVGKTFDACAPAIALGQAIGRLGCFAAGCDYGKPTTGFLKVVFTNPVSHEATGVPLGISLHPTQIYESLAALAVFGALLWRFPRKNREGEIFILYLGLYALARFFLEFFRGDEDRGFVFNHLLSTSQFISLLAIVTAAALAVKLRGRAAEMPRPLAALPSTKRARS